jgi:hypothetical protein
MAKVQDVAFLILCTSPKNFEAWVAVADGSEYLSALLKKGIGVDTGSSGAARVAGSIHFKPGYAPDYPTVRIVELQTGWIVKSADLYTLGLIVTAHKP